MTTVEYRVRTTYTKSKKLRDLVHRATMLRALGYSTKQISDQLKVSEWMVNVLLDVTERS